MHILQLCKKFPYPIKDGESIAVTYLAKGLQKLGHEISLLAMNTTKHPVRVSSVRAKMGYYKEIHHSRIDNEVKPLHAFLNLFSSDSYNISRFDNEAFRIKLIKLLSQNQYDIIQLESLYLAPYIDDIRANSDAPVVLRAHNVEHEIWERMAQNEPMGLRRWYLEYSGRKLKKYEEEQLHHIDHLIPISDIDETKFRRIGYRGSSMAIPIGLDLANFKPQLVDEGDLLSISFIGSLDWMPNIEGLNWFLDHVWPHVNEIFPKLKLHVAGRNCPEWIKNMQVKNLIVEGEVRDSSKFITKHPIMVVPLLSGSGLRAKIIEAMALGRVVISTSLGLEGIPAKDKNHVLVANSAQDFIRKLTFCHRHRKHLCTLSRKARQLTERHYDHISLAKSLSNRYLQLIGVCP